MNLVMNLIDCQPDVINEHSSNEAMAETISQHSVFYSLSREDKQQLYFIVSFKKVMKNETIFEVEDPPNHIYYLYEGSLTLNFPDNTKLQVKPNEIIGEMGLLNGDFRLGKLVANEDSELIAICGSTLFDASIISPHIGLHVIKRLSKRVTDFLKAKQNISS